MYFENHERSRMTDYYYLAKTKEEEEVLLEELSEIYESLYVTKPGATQEVLDQKVRHSVASLVRENLDDKLLKDLMEKIKSRRLLKLTLAIDPSEDIISEVYEWAVKNISEDIVIDISKDKEILGGAIVSYEGKYFDYTLWKTLRNI